MTGQDLAELKRNLDESLANFDLLIGEPSLRTARPDERKSRYVRLLGSVSAVQKVLNNVESLHSYWIQFETRKKLIQHSILECDRWESES